MRRRIAPDGRVLCRHIRIEFEAVKSAARTIARLIVVANEVDPLLVGLAVRRYPRFNRTVREITACVGYS